MLEVLRPGELHQVEDLEELSKVQVLLRGDYVYHFIELIFLVSLDRAAYVTGQVDRGSIYE